MGHILIENRNGFIKGVEVGRHAATIGQILLGNNRRFTVADGANATAAAETTTIKRILRAVFAAAGAGQQGKIGHKKLPIIAAQNGLNQPSFTAFQSSRLYCHKKMGCAFSPPMRSLCGVSFPADPGVGRAPNAAIPPLFALLQPGYCMKKVDPGVGRAPDAAIPPLFALL